MLFKKLLPIGFTESFNSSRRTTNTDESQMVKRTMSRKFKPIRNFDVIHFYSIEIYKSYLFIQFFGGVNFAIDLLLLVYLSKPAC